MTGSSHVRPARLWLRAWMKSPATVMMKRYAVLVTRGPWVGGATGVDACSVSAAPWTASRTYGAGGETCLLPCAMELPYANDAPLRQAPRPVPGSHHQEPRRPLHERHTRRPRVRLLRRLRPDPRRGAPL